MNGVVVRLSEATTQTNKPIGQVSSTEQLVKVQKLKHNVVVVGDTSGTMPAKTKELHLRDIFDETVGKDVSDENGRKVLDMVEKVLRANGYKDDEQMYRLTVRLLWCESRLDPKAQNRQSVVINGVNYGKASGLFQFLPSTFAGVGGNDIWSIEEQTEAYIALYKANRLHEWACY